MHTPFNFIYLSLSCIDFPIQKFYKAKIKYTIVFSLAFVYEMAQSMSGSNVYGQQHPKVT